MATASTAQQSAGTGLDRLRDIIREKSLLKDGNFTLASGKPSSFFFNMKMTMLDPEGANLIAEAILDKVKNLRVDAIGGLEMGAVPIVSVVAAKSQYTDRPFPAFFVRKERKDHGTAQLIDGPLTAGMHVVMVEDVTTTGGSVMKAIAAAREAGCTVDTVVTVVDRQEGAAANLEKEGITLMPILTRADFE